MADKKLADCFVFFGPVGNVCEFSSRADELNEWFEFDILVKTRYKSSESFNPDAVIRADDSQIGG